MVHGRGEKGLWTKCLILEHGARPNLEEGVAFVFWFWRFCVDSGLKHSVTDAEGFARLGVSPDAAASWRKKGVGSICH